MARRSASRSECCQQRRTLSDKLATVELDNNTLDGRRAVVTKTRKIGYVQIIGQGSSGKYLSTWLHKVTECHAIMFLSISLIKNHNVH